MPTELEQIRNQQQATWDEFSSGWQKWDELVLGWLAPVGVALLDEARLRPDSHVLDISSGTGEPALSAAERCPSGKVVVTDLSEQMLLVAKENAGRRGLRNVEFHQCDAGALPFPDNSFDAVTGRFGFMFFPDILVAARELVRVTKPGGRVCHAVWGVPAKNPWATAIMGTIARHVEMPPQPADAPGLFRCAAPGAMTKLFAQAGLKNVTEKEVLAPLTFENPDQYFTFMSEIAAPVVAGLSKADPATRAKIKEVVIGLVSKPGDGKTRLDGAATVIFGEK
jgi:ubiquinone/menaquinone biosynthesis C-methylase UbiE